MPAATKADYEAFQGLRAEFTRGVSQNFQVGHLLSMGDDKAGPSYQLITSYVTDSVRASRAANERSAFI